MLLPAKLWRVQPLAAGLCVVCLSATLLGAAAIVRDDPAPPEPSLAVPVEPAPSAPEIEGEREIPVTYEAPPLPEAEPEPLESPPAPEPEPEPDPTLTILPTPLVDCWTPTGEAPIVAVPKEGQNVPDDLELVSTFLATAYCTTGTTSTGTWTTVNRTLAVNPAMIPYGSHVWLFLDDGTLVGDFWAEDTGSNMLENPYVIDIYMGEDRYDECIQWGTQHVTVYIEPEE